MLPGELDPVDVGNVLRGTSAAAALLDHVPGAMRMPTIAPEFEGRGVWFERGGFARSRIDRATAPIVRQS